MSQQHRLGFVLLLTLSLLVAACGGQSATTNGSSSGSTASGTATSVATSAPTAPSKSKPSAIPTTTVALCEGWISFAEANQILNPPAAIVNVVPGNATAISTCQFISAPGKVPLLLSVEAFPAGTQMSTFAAEAAAKNFDGATVTTSHAVSGVGDQAWFVAGSLSSSSINARGDVLYVADGGIIFIIENLNINGASPIGSTDDTTIQSQFVQIGNLIISRF